MAEARRFLYGGPNGDRWELIRDDTDRTGRVFVRHTPNPESGGLVGEFEIGEFLIRGLHGPEHLALLGLIGGLVERDAGAEPPAQS